MQTKKTIRTFCGCTPSQKKILNLIRVLLVHIKKHRHTGWTSRYTKYQKIKRQINCGKNYSINIRLTLKSRLVWKKKNKVKLSSCYMVRLSYNWKFCGHLCPFSFHYYLSKNQNVYWPISVNSSTARCLSNAVVNVHRKC